MTLTKKDFIKHLCGKDGLNATIVTHIVNEMELWVKESLLNGNDVRFDIGKISIVANKYAANPALNRKGSFHQHVFRPQFTFLQRFKEEIDRREETIRQGKN